MQKSEIDNIYITMNEIGENIWAEPNEYYGILICTESKYAEMLISKGTLKLNTPLSWVNCAKTDGDGRGDILEGAFASCFPSEINAIANYHRKYCDVYGELVNGLMYFRRERTMNLPCFCFLQVSLDFFECPKNTGVQKITGYIPAKYFMDFADKKEQPSIVYINNFSEFRVMFKKKLSEIGVKEDEIIIERINYLPKKIPFQCPGESPNELKVKDSWFDYQHEGRIVLNIDDPILLSYFNKNTIDIGTLKDIAEKKDIYLSDGMGIEKIVNIIKK
jgi:hypothetical protein